MGWNTNFSSFKPYETLGGILLEVCFRILGQSFSILTYYGPYKERESFWNWLESSCLLGINDLILAGELKFSLSPGEVWGNHARVDQDADYFSSLFLRSNLVDVLPVILEPTWSNRRCR